MYLTEKNRSKVSSC